MDVRVLFALLLTLLTVFSAPPARDGVQGGDQFLDGIGETALVARYVFVSNTEDSSRNSLHASLRGVGGEFVEDSQFGRVLFLPGSGAHVQLPGQALAGEDTISITGWLFLPTGSSGCFFDFGRSGSDRLFAEVSRSSFRAVASAGGARGETPSKSVPENQWVHLAVVLDPADKVLTSYLDGARAGQATGVTVNAAQMIDQASAEANHLYLGRSHDAGQPTLHARLRDVRIYRVALTDQQVATIRNNALSGRPSGGSGGRGGPTAVVPSDTIPRESEVASRLERVPDIVAETVVGELPHLPPTIPAVYRNKAKGPDVRVIWPAPKDNSDVLSPGVYTVTGRVPGTAFEPKARVTVRAAVKIGAAPSRSVEPFPLSYVLLEPDTKGRETQFIKNRDKFIRGLAATNPDNFLYNFRDAFGQPQPAGAEQLGGWDNQTTRLRGHASGHYLSAIAQAYASTTYDETLRATFLQKMNYMIDTLYDLSRKSGRPAKEGGPFVADPTAVPPGPGRSGYDSNLRAGAIRTDYWNWGVGFISAYPPDQFIMLEQGATYGSRDTQVWAPYYTLHKILAGLLDCYEVGGNEKALEIARGMGSWVYARLRVLPAETRIAMWNRYIAGEYGGSNEVMARLYRLTKDRQFLECARLFDNISFFFGNAAHDHGLAKNVDTIRGKHANQHIPQITGALETYRNTREIAYFQIARNFWEKVTNSYMYSIGGVAGARNPNNAECFTAEPDTLWENGFSAGGQNETCCTYNLLKLDRQLFMFDQVASYMDHYERGLYNHILASVAENDPGNTYHVPLNPGSQKRFGNAKMNGFSCCNGTALESNTKLQDSIYFRSADNKALYVNLFVPSTLNWPERKLVVRQVTDFPYADATRLVMKGSAGQLDVRIRVPRWATRGFSVTVNGRTQSVKAVPGTYLTLSRNWRDNDTIEVRMPFRFYLEPVMDQPNVASIFYGPVLLAAEEPAPRTDWRKVTLDASDIGNSVTGDPATLRFKVGDANLKPFYETYGRYSVYFHVMLK
ncbi:MAG: beta-L-arabinofuranosidase domain-containing protein [Vicinamibacterales bacterium]